MKNAVFKPGYIAGPLAILVISIGLAVWFYHLLPPSLAYHFAADGTGDKFTGPIAVIAVGIGIQLVLTAAAWGIARWAANLGRGQTGGAVPVGFVVSFMGNIMAVPQLIAGFVMADIFSYNAYQFHLMPVWLFVVIVLVLSVIALGVFWAVLFSKIRQQN